MSPSVGKDRRIRTSSVCVRAAYRIGVAKPARDSRFAEDRLKKITALYRIEGQARSTPAGEQRDLRQQKSAVDIAECWNGLVLFMTDGGIEIDSNVFEHTALPIALPSSTAKSEKTSINLYLGASKDDESKANVGKIRSQG